MLTWKRIGDDRYRISKCYFWPKYDVELIKPLPKGWMLIGHLKNEQEQSGEEGILDHIDAESFEDKHYVVWLPCRVIKIYANL